MKALLVIIITLLALSGCKKPIFSEQEKSGAISFVEKGTALSELAAGGTNFTTFSAQYSALSANWDTLYNTNWSRKMYDEGELIKTSMGSWQLAHIYWAAAVRSEPVSLTPDQSKLVYDVCSTIKINLNNKEFSDTIFEEFQSSNLNGDTKKMISIFLRAGTLIFEEAKKGVYFKVNFEK